MRCATAIDAARREGVRVARLVRRPDARTRCRARDSISSWSARYLQRDLFRATATARSRRAASCSTKRSRRRSARSAAGRRRRIICSSRASCAALRRRSRCCSTRRCRRRRRSRGCVARRSAQLSRQSSSRGSDTLPGCAAPCDSSRVIVGAAGHAEAEAVGDRPIARRRRRRRGSVWYASIASRPAAAKPGNPLVVLAAARDAPARRRRRRRESARTTSSGGAPSRGTNAGRPRDSQRVERLVGRLHVAGRRPARARSTAGRPTCPDRRAPAAGSRRRRGAMPSVGEPRDHLAGRDRCGAGAARRGTRAAPATPDR